MVSKDKQVIEDFGYEWEAYNQQNIDKMELEKLYLNYFDIFPFEVIGKESKGFDMGCGSGRWAKFIAPKVKILNCIEPSQKAIIEAKNNLKQNKNCKFFNYGVFDNPLEDGSQDFGYCLGVLHHILDTKKGLKKSVDKLKKDAPFLLYLYYRFDNKPLWYQIIWRISNIIRLGISIMPFKIKLKITKLIAFIVYFPIARFSLLLEKIGFNVDNMPLSSYKHTSLYTMKTDSLDRFGTKLEHRFTQKEIFEMMERSGLKNIVFSNKSPYWVAVGFKK